MEAECSPLGTARAGYRARSGAGCRFWPTNAVGYPLAVWCLLLETRMASVTSLVGLHAVELIGGGLRVGALVLILVARHVVTVDLLEATTPASLQSDGGQH